MFPANDNQWKAYLIDASPENESPCWIDIVGDASHPAGFYYLDPPSDPDPTSVAFRMRLNGDPLSNNPNQYRLREFVWGVQVRTKDNVLLYDIRLNASGANYKLQILDSAGNEIASWPIDLTDPEKTTNNTRVRAAGTVFPCGGPSPDPDYFLDFTVPTSYFGSFNFASSTYRLCYYTSTQDNNINKEFLCGPILNPPAGEPVLEVSKRIVCGPSSLCTGETGSWILLITLKNAGTVPIDDIYLYDLITPELNLTETPIITVSKGYVFTFWPSIFWIVGGLGVNETAYMLIQITGRFALSGQIVLDTGVVWADDMEPIYFSDTGVTVNDKNQLRISKAIVSGPETIEKCKTGTWKVRITAENVGNTELSPVVVNDVISPLFTVESLPIIEPSLGSADLFGNDILWTIDVLPANSSATLDVTLTGAFIEAGLQILDSGTGNAPCSAPVDFRDAGVLVKDEVLPGKVKVHLCVGECKCGKIHKPLGGVTVKIYDNQCKLINKLTIDSCTVITLDKGSYTLEFMKMGYQRKYLALLLGSNEDIHVDICLDKKFVCQPSHHWEPGVGFYQDVDLDRFKMDVIFSEEVCIPPQSTLDCICDVVDKATPSAGCDDGLKMELDIEKNVIYKIGGIKELKYDTYHKEFCLPVGSIHHIEELKHKTEVEKVWYYKKGNKAINIALIRLKLHYDEHCHDDCDQVE